MKRDTKLIPDTKADVKECADVNSKPNEKAKQTVATTVVLVEEYKHSVVENMHIAKATLDSALPFIVQYRLWKIPVLPPSPQESVAKVDVLAIHEKVLVEMTNRIES